MRPCEIYVSHHHKLLGQYFTVAYKRVNRYNEGKYIKKVEEDMKSIKKWSFTQVMVFGFLALILVGACILMLPICNANGKWLNFPDALFTSCTCVCVTGLVTVVPAFQFTFLGKLVMLFLIQVGGWGVIVCVTYVLVLMKVKLTIQERVMLQNYFNRDSMRGLVGILQYVVKGSLVVEGIGALGYACRFIPQFGLLRGIWYAVFHSISAFCNAGVDLLGESSLAMYADDVLINTVTAFLENSVSSTSLPSKSFPAKSWKGLASSDLLSDLEEEAFVSFSNFAIFSSILRIASISSCKVLSSSSVKESLLVSMTSAK